MKKILIFLFLSILFALISACGNAVPASRVPDRVVTGIDVYCQKPTCVVTRRYTQPEKVQTVLTYLRLLRPIGPMLLPPEARQGDLYEIVVHLQDGGYRIHRQYSAQYVEKSSSFLGTVDPTLGSKLPFLIALLPGDSSLEVPAFPEQVHTQTPAPENH